MDAQQNSLIQLIIEHGFGERYTWLDQLSYSEAFLVCIGAGPWKFSRRKLIQSRALDWLRGRDLSEVPDDEEPPYPLAWQMSYTRNLRKFLRATDRTMQGWCERLRTAPDARSWFFREVGSPNGAKVLSLFLRDKIRAESFPIDRHVKRTLQENSLPQTEDGMISLCKSIGYDPCTVATMIIQVASEDSSGTFNPIHSSRVK